MDSSKIGEDKKKQTGRWSEEQHQRFMMGIMSYGKDWKKVEEVVGTRSGSQVRSHAQKFFNKLQKQDKDKPKTLGSKKQLNTQKVDMPVEKQNELDQGDASQSFNELLRTYNEEASNSTPLELVSMIRSHTNNNRTDMNNLKRDLVEKIQIIEEQAEEKELQPPMLISRNSYKSMNNIISAYENVKEGQNVKEGEKSEKIDFQDQSFLILLTKKYKKYFSQGGKFQNLIDFGKKQQVQNFERSIRKRSFTLPEGVQGDQQDLNERKKKIFNEPKLCDIDDEQKSSFAEAMQKKKKQMQAIDAAQKEKGSNNSKNQIQK